MKRVTKTCLAGTIALSACLRVAIAGGGHADDVLVGRSSAGQLKIGGFIPDLNVIVLPPTSGLLEGWADNDPGFDHVATAEPGEDLYPLSSGVLVWIEVVQVDPAFRAISPSFVIIDEPGERIQLGGASLHTHLTWHINSASPGYDPLKTLWRATFRLVDTGSTGYVASEPFTFYFARVACTAGDCNGDDAVDGDDIPGFVAALLHPAAAADELRCAADANLDGYVTGDDVAAFVALLLEG